MNIWQKSFLVFALVASAVLAMFPPQMTPNREVMFLLFTYDFPVDWLRLFLWFTAIILVAGLGIAVNKAEHQ